MGYVSFSPRAWCSFSCLFLVVKLSNSFSTFFWNESFWNIGGCTATSGVSHVMSCGVSEVWSSTPPFLRPFEALPGPDVWPTGQGKRRSDRQRNRGKSGHFRLIQWVGVRMGPASLRADLPSRTGADPRWDHRCSIWDRCSRASKLDRPQKMEQFSGYDQTSVTFGDFEDWSNAHLGHGHQSILIAIHMEVLP